ncbi:MAG: hypothetical protein ABR556_00410, partial [Pyrinomonadaceae bacterium]
MIRVYLRSSAAIFFRFQIHIPPCSICGSAFVDTILSHAGRSATMDNESIARRFYRLAALMDIRGDDPF